jgi:hypothetical protein
MLVTRTSVKVVLALGMTLIGIGIFWATEMPVHGHYWANMFGPMIVVGIGTAFAFIPVSIGALTGVVEHEAGLASGLVFTSQELGGAIGIAIGSTVAATHYQALMAAGSTTPAALTSSFQQAYWVLGAIALLAVPAVFALMGRRTTPAASSPCALDAQPAVAGAES